MRQAITPMTSETNRYLYTWGLSAPTGALEETAIQPGRRHA